jgi:signal transduction histidine kinase
MQFSTLRRTTTFRLAAIYGLVFALGTSALLGIVYVQSAAYLTRRVDGILNTEADALARSPAPDLRPRIADELAMSGDRTTAIGLFAPDGMRLAGNVEAMPPALKVGGKPVEVAPTAAFPTAARLIARRLPDGEMLVVGRDVNQLRQIREIIASALIGGGGAIILVGLACGIALSIQPLRRLRTLQDTGEEIARGDLKRRMPISRRHDELDMLAATVNYMMGQVERLMAEVRAATETIAHDLLTPLTRASTQLHRIEQTGEVRADSIARLAAEVDEVLDRFRAILRISELEARDRRAGFVRTDLADIVEPVAELYQPLAEARGVWLSAAAERGAVVEMDPKLMIEAVSNLVDNAIKFSPQGGSVQMRIGGGPDAPEITVQDNGPGIPAGERGAVLQRFYRGERNRMTPGTGLGLSIVAAIVRLHGFELKLDDANPGLRVHIDCQIHPLSY